MTLEAFSKPHPWDTLLIHTTPLSTLQGAHASIAHHLSLLDCRGHDARDMQRTLNYIAAELNTRAATENSEIQLPASQYIQYMHDADAQWEKDHGDNPRWGEGRAAHHEERKTGGKLRRLVAKVQGGAMQKNDGKQENLGESVVLEG